MRWHTDWPIISVPSGNGGNDGMYCVLFPVVDETLLGATVHAAEPSGKDKLECHSKREASEDLGGGAVFHRPSRFEDGVHANQTIQTGCAERCPQPDDWQPDQKDECGAELLLVDA